MEKIIVNDETYYQKDGKLYDSHFIMLSKLETEKVKPYIKHKTINNIEFRGIEYKEESFQHLENLAKINRKNILEELQHRKELLLKLEKFGFEGFLHTTNLNNFISIMKTGLLLSRKSLNRKNMRFEDNAEKDIINATPDFIISKVRFFYRPITPTNISAYINHNQIHPVILVFDKKLIFDERVWFCDGCAKSYHTKITPSASCALKFNWEMIFDSKPISELDRLKNEIGKGPKHYRNAEFMLEDSISINKLVKVYFKNIYDMFYALSLFGNNEKFILDPSKFYRG